VPSGRHLSGSTTFTVLNKVKIKKSHYKPRTDLEGSNRLRLPDFKTIGT
jgi:hypothetical protein